MSVQLKLSAVRDTKWYEYLIRFLFGGLLTAATGLITNLYGPVIGGLFLAFPSIFPASVTLVQSHKKEKQEEKGQHPETAKDIARLTAGKTAEGAVFGSLGLFFFALIIWKFSTNLPPWLVLALALLVWFASGVVFWWIYSRITGSGANLQDEIQR